MPILFIKLTNQQSFVFRKDVRISKPFSKCKLLLMIGLGIILKSNGAEFPTAATFTLNTHATPPKSIAKLAVPVDVGVPDIANTKFPFPVVKVPGCMDAVNPSTPVDATNGPANGYAAPLPPVYAIVAVPINAVFIKASGEMIALAQSNV